MVKKRVSCTGDKLPTRRLLEVLLVLQKCLRQGRTGWHYWGPSTAGCSSGGRALCCEGLDPPWRINPAWRKHLEFGIFSVPTSGGSIKGCGMFCPVYRKVHIKDPLLLIGKSSLCGDSGLPSKKYVTMTICLMSNSWWYENQCSLEVSLNKTNFLYWGLCINDTVRAEYSLARRSALLG